MSVSGPFVNRTSELNRMRNGLRPESDAQMYTVSGPKGFGKSTLLEKFATECESDETPVIWYDFNEPETVQIFLQRFLKEWEKKFPESVVNRVREEISPQTIKSLTGASAAIDPSGGIGSTAVGGILAKIFNTGEDITTTIDPVSFALDIIERESEKHDKIVIIVDEYDLECLRENQSQNFNSIFREFADSLPENVTWYLGSSRHIPNALESILQVSVGELDEYATEKFVYELGFSPEDDLIGELYNRTRGHPFVLDQLLKIADEEGLEEALDESPLKRPELMRYLERSLLDQLFIDEEQLLRDSCVLQELRPHVLSEITDRTSAEVRQLLKELHQRGMVKRRSKAGGTIFRCHDLQRDYIIQEESLHERRRNHLNAARTFLIHAGNCWCETEEANSSRDEQSLEKYIKYMSNFDYQIDQIRNHYSIEQCIELILSDMERIEVDFAINALEEYYSSKFSSGSNLDSDTIKEAIQGI